MLLVAQGYAVGNGVTDDEVDGNAIIPFAYGKSLLSMQLYTDLMQACQGSFWNATEGKPSHGFLTLSPQRMFFSRERKWVIRQQYESFPFPFP